MFGNKIRFYFQVADTPQEIPFLSILQHLLRIDPKEAISDIIWDTAETLVHRATLLENREDSTRLLRAPSVQKFTCTHCSPNRKQSLAPVSSTIPTLLVSVVQMLSFLQIRLLTNRNPFCVHTDFTNKYRATGFKFKSSKTSSTTASNVVSIFQIMI